MAGPFIFIGTHTLEQGKFEDFKANCRALAEVVEAEEPRMIAFNVYASEDGTEVSVVQVHPDAESMMFHMQVVRQHITGAYADSLEQTTSMAVYGPPNDDVLHCHCAAARRVRRWRVRPGERRLPAAADDVRTAD
jgi:quinol monooxygenase YgiN